MFRSCAPETCSTGINPVWMPWSSPMPLLRLDAAHAIAVCVAVRLKKNLRNAASKSAGDATSCRSIDCGNGRLVPVCLGNERIFSQLLLQIFHTACRRFERQLKNPGGSAPGGLQYTIHPSVGRGIRIHTSDCECYNDLCVTHDALERWHARLVTWMDRGSG